MLAEMTGIVYHKKWKQILKYAKTFLCERGCASPNSRRTPGEGRLTGRRHWEKALLSDTRKETKMMLVDGKPLAKSLIEYNLAIFAAVAYILNPND